MYILICTIKWILFGYYSIFYPYRVWKGNSQGVCQKYFPRGIRASFPEGSYQLRQAFQWASPGKLFFHGTIFGIIHNIAFHIPVWVKNGIAQFDLLSPISGGGDSLIKAGRYGCAVSAKTMPGQNSVQKPNDWASFHYF